MIVEWPILGDPGANNGSEGKSKRAGKYGTKKSKERREEPLGTMSYQTSSKRSPPFWLLIGQINTKVFWHQQEARTAAFGIGLVRPCPQGLFSPFFTFLRAIFFHSFRVSLAPTICSWVSEDGNDPVTKSRNDLQWSRAALNEPRRHQT